MQKGNWGRGKGEGAGAMHPSSGGGTDKWALHEKAVKRAFFTKI